MAFVKHVSGGENFPCQSSADPISQDLASYQDRFLQISAEHEFLAHAQVAIAANRLAFVTKSASAAKEAVAHHALAIEGLRREMASFSRSNMDAVLTATLLIQSQQSDW